MSFKVKIFDDYATIDYFNVLTGSDLIESTIPLINSPKFDDLFYIICDFSTVSEVNVNETDMDVLVAMDTAASHWNKKLKLACISTNPRVELIVIDYKKKLVQTGWQILLFNDFNKAIKWCTE